MNFDTQNIKAGDLVYKLRGRNSIDLYIVKKSEKENSKELPFFITTEESNYYFDNNGISSYGSRVVVLYTPENKKFLEDLHLINYEKYEDSFFYKNIKQDFSTLIDRLESYPNVSFNEELSKELRTLYSKYYKD